MSDFGQMKQMLEIAKIDFEVVEDFIHTKPPPFRRKSWSEPDDEPTCTRCFLIRVHGGYSGFYSEVLFKKDDGSLFQWGSYEQ